MKKKTNEELDEILEDETLEDEADDVVLDDEVIDDEAIDDEVIDDEELEVEPKGKKAKKDKKGKKKLSKGAVIGISVSSSVVGVVAIVLVVLFVILPLFTKTAATDFEALLAVNGYQNYKASNSASLMSDATESKIIPVSEMMDATGYSINDTAEFAAALYSLAIYNYANVKGSGWYCYTDSSVYAKDVTASLRGMEFSFPKFNVGVRAAYALGYVEADQPNAAQVEADQNNFFSQTISGVTKLDIEGLPSFLTDFLKGLFGYNCIEMLYNGTYAYKRGENGGAEFKGDADEESYKYLMGAYNKKLYAQKGYSAKDKDPDSGYPEMTYITDTYSNDYSEAKSLEYLDTPEDIIVRESPWGALDTKYDFAFYLTPFDEQLNYTCGTYGAGWATYYFTADTIDAAKTKITYKDHIYTIDLAVKETAMDEACEFAKGSLTKDTKDYIQLQSPKYSLSKNIIKIYDNGLIASWEREETVASEAPAKLTILTGECANGGGTTNHTYMAFSYSPIDYEPTALAARYLPEVSSKITIDKKWPTLANYDPKKNDYTKLK